MSASEKQFWEEGYKAGFKAGLEKGKIIAEADLEEVAGDYFLLGQQAMEGKP